MNRPEIILRPGVMEELERRLDTNKTGLTVITGISSSQIYRIRKGKSKVGVDFIAALLKADPTRKFEDYFMILNSLHECNQQKRPEEAIGNDIQCI